jgi:hypothetical protein
LQNNTVQAILNKAFSAYERAHDLPAHVRKAASALIRCRTAALGGHVQSCPEEHYHKQWYNSCRHRLCPQCNLLRLNLWLDRQLERLIQCEHYHAIFTTPHDLNDLWLCNVRKMTDLLFTAVRDTLFEFFQDPRHIGAKPGLITTLHTWSQTLILHLHIHCLITAGGLSEGRWVSAKNGYLLPVRAVMPKFRGKYLDYLDAAVEKGELTLPGGMTLQRWKNLKNKLGRKKWSVNIRERYAYGKGVLIYLSKYIRGGPISNRRIVSNTENGITFRYRLPGKSQKKQGTMPIPMSQFLKRYFLHVPEPNTKVVRYYGLYAPTAKEELALARAHFGQTEMKEIEEPDWQSYCETKGDEHPERCPICGLRLIRTRDIPRPRERTFIPWGEEPLIAA